MHVVPILGFMRLLEVLGYCEVDIKLVQEYAPVARRYTFSSLRSKR